jgi:hypothetical protein
MFYHQTKFKFSELSKQWIMDRYKSKFDRKFYHDLDIEQYAVKSQYEWRDSIAGKELSEFLSTYDIDLRFFKVAAFISNSNSWFQGNPHIDFDSISRFNVMIAGNPADSMVWWDHFCHGDKRLVVNKFTSLSGKDYYASSIPGSTVDERWNYLGNPTETVDNLLQPSAFVRTDCAHTVNVTPGPRLIVTVSLNRPIEKIIACCKN